MQIFIKMKLKALYKDSIVDGHLILTPTTPGSLCAEFSIERCMLKTWQGQVFFSWASLFTNLVSLSIYKYTQATDNSQGGQIKYLGKTLMD